MVIKTWIIWQEINFTFSCFVCLYIITQCFQHHYNDIMVACAPKYAFLDFLLPLL